MNLISNKQPKQDLIDIQVKEYKVTIEKVKIIETQNDTKTLIFFLNNIFKKVMSEAGYSEISHTGIYFNNKDKKENSNLNMYSGFKTNFDLL